MESNPLVHFSKTMCAQHNSLQIFGKYSLENSVKKYVPSQGGLEFKTFLTQFTLQCSGNICTYLCIHSLLQIRQFIGRQTALWIFCVLNLQVYHRQEFGSCRVSGYSGIYVFTGDLTQSEKVSKIEPLLVNAYSLREF